MSARFTVSNSGNRSRSHAPFITSSLRHIGHLTRGYLQNSCSSWMTGIQLCSSFQTISEHTLREVSRRVGRRVLWPWLICFCITIDSSDAAGWILWIGCGCTAGQVRVCRASHVCRHSAKLIDHHSRAGFPEGRDSYKLKSKGNIVLCYKCKGSAAPVGPGTAQGLSLGRKIVTCDYCPLSWHLDCLEPPAANMPNSQRKWMCPNHAAQVLVCSQITYSTFADSNAISFLHAEAQETAAQIRRRSGQRHSARATE